MTKTAPTAIAVGTAAVAIIGILFGTEVKATAWRSDDWFRLLITAIALGIAAYVIYKNRTEIALNDSVSALKTAVEAHKIEAEALSKRLESILKEKGLLEAEIIALRSKTDVGEVLRMLTVLTSNTFRLLEENGEILRDVQKAVHGWKLDRRSALRKSDNRSGRGTSEENDRGGRSETQSDDRRRNASNDSGDRRKTDVRGREMGEEIDESRSNLGGHYRIPFGEPDE